MLNLTQQISSRVTKTLMNLMPLLIGQPADNLNAARRRMVRHVRGNTFAKSALETALLDAHGKRLGLPVSSLLGGAQHAHLLAAFHRTHFLDALAAHFFQHVEEPADVVADVMFGIGHRTLSPNSLLFGT